ncbi:hypothetical protein D0Y65_012523, partial [Glycine soja]
VRPEASPSFNVVSYGAKGDGKTDDSQETATLDIPGGKTFMLQPVSFQGPCKPETMLGISHLKILWLLGLRTL